MNTTEILGMCKEIYRDYKGMGRKRNEMDDTVLACIMRMYNTTDLDWEEIRWLWIRYLETGNLYFAEALEMARKREVQELRETEMVLNAWLAQGIL